ncbi:hypothetical protein H8S95_06230 [Pontibacter sp. KCTC 32443]|uniref:hypothetical protein n=1 Tax=Pontibacter TaxID=323449 RepID=UPI00164D7430|nr:MULTISPECIES: hypothetical protein [Pontibacter]MBC5773653.1 hypothetical protein [Pontibacter sp. KCTC 32443]
MKTGLNESLLQAKVWTGPVKYRIISSGWLKEASAIILLIVLALFSPARLQAQDDTKVEAYDTLKLELEKYPNTTSGEFTPGRGFDIYKSKWGSLNLSIYGLFRYINQQDSDRKYIDHLGREKPVDPRQDFQWHRTFVWASGFFYTPRFRYVISLWSLPTTDQTLLFGNFQYRFHRAATLGAGIGPNLGVRSMQGPWPFFMSSDRIMAEEALRPGFTSGIWVNGEALPRLHYWLFMGNNMSQLGITANQLTRHLTKSASVWWMPTTGEFGPRGGFGDFEQHEKGATRFGASFVYAREDRSNAISNPTPASTQIRISDGSYLFETGALADGVTVQRANYEILSVDAGWKYRGLHLQTEFFFRRLYDFNSTGPLPISEINDNGFYVQASYPIIKKRLHMYGAYSMVVDEFDRDPWEVVGGLNYYPSGTRNWRLNLHALRVEKSPAGSQFGFYVPGQTGATLSIGTDILL